MVDGLVDDFDTICNGLLWIWCKKQFTAVYHVLMIGLFRHQVRISYLKYRLQNIPHGNFGTVEGKCAVYITYDPSDPRIDSYHKRKLFVDSQEGQLYKPVIEEYLSIKEELKQLEKQWNRLYKFPPKEVKYPLPDDLNNPISSGMFDRAAANQNTFENEYPIVHAGQRLRSKNELIAFQTLEKMGFEVKTEARIDKGGFSSFFPDALFKVPEFDKGIGLEIDGAMDKDDYFGKAEERRKKYLRNGFREGIDVIFFRIYNRHDFDLERFELAVDAVLEANAKMILNRHSKLCNTVTNAIISGF